MTDSERVVFEWFERVFFGGMELSFLSTPAFPAVMSLQGYDPDAISLAGLAAVAAGSVALALFRSRRVDVGAWPRRGELTSLPLRVGYFSALFLVATVGVAVVGGPLESRWFVLLGAAVEAAGLAAFPSVYRAVYGDPFRKPARRV